jgi:hypothetical protein
MTAAGAARYLLLAVIVLAALYPIVMRVVASRVQPFRLKLAAAGDELLSTPELTWAQTKIVQAMLASAFEWRFMVIMTACLPVFVWRFSRGKVVSPFAGLNFVTLERVNRLAILHLVSTAAANPVFFVVAAVEFTVLAIPFHAVHVLRGRTTPPVRDTAREIAGLVGVYAQRALSRT